MHDNEVTFSIVCGEKDGFLPVDVPGSYERVCEALESGFRSLGIPARQRGCSSPVNPVSGTGRKTPFFCFEKPSMFDIESGGKKLAGSAQRRSRGVLLHHGSVLLSYAGSERSKPAGAGAGRGLSFAELKNALVRGFEKVLGAEFFEDRLSESEKSLLDELLQTKYRSPQRNESHS